MKKCILLLCTLLCFCLVACSNQKSISPVAETSIQQEAPDTQSSPEATEGKLQSESESESQSDSIDLQHTQLPSDHPETHKTEERKLTLTIGAQEIPITLYDNPAANALYEMLPLTLSFEDFNGIEKIAYMDRELSTEDAPDAYDPNIGDLCLYAPWGNLSIFYQDFGMSNGLISLGYLDSDVELIKNMQGDFSATLDKAE